MFFLMRQVCTLAAVLFAVTAAAQTVYRCPGQNGQAVFQQAPCPSGGHRVRVQPGNIIETPAASSPGLLASAQRRSLIEGGRLFEGMTASEVRQVLGAPRAVNRSAGSYGTREQWVYRYPDGSRRFVYLRDGELDSVSTVESEHPRRLKQREDCPSDLAIRNASVGLSSTTLPPEERARRAEVHRRMLACR